MKYKNRLIIPTLVSTSLLASTMVANAEEVNQDDQYSGQNTEEYSVNDETSETDLDFIESEEEASAEEAEDEDSDENSEEEASDESDEETNELEETEETEAAPAEEVVENNLDETNIETETAETTEVPVEETVPAEEIAENEEDLEAPAEAQASEENIAMETYDQEAEVTAEPEERTEAVEPVEETAPREENNVEDVTAETVEEPVEAAESVEQSAETEQNTEVTAVEENTEEVVAEESDNQDTEVQNTESENVAPAEEQSVEVDENVLEEADPADEDTEPVEQPEQPIDSEQSSEDNNEEVSALESTEEAAEPAESDEQKSEIPESAEKDTYKYDSESLKQALENLSEEEQTVFLEENAEDIEVDEEMLNSLSESLAANNEEINADEVVAAASTISTMSLSQTITDINDYIAENDFDVADIQYDYIPGLPEYAYHSNYGSEPENGEVGKPKGVVLHDVGNENSTIYGEIEYMSRNWENAFVHAFVDADNIIQVADTDYLAYGAGPYSNDLHMHVELVRHDNAHDFAKSINNYADYIANLLYKYKLPAVSAEETGEGTLWSHVAVSNHLSGTASPDPYEYFARFDYEYNDVINLITNRYNDMYNKNTAPQISMPIEQGTTDLLAEVNTNNSGLYESVTDVRTKNANNLLGQQFRVVRTAVYNYDEYYLLEDENGVSLGWMYAGDLTTSEYVPEVENEEDLKEPKPEAPEVPAEPELEESDDTADEEQAPEEDEPNDVVEEDNTADEQPQDEENTNTGSEEGSVEESEDSTEEEQTDEQPVEPANPETPEEPAQTEDDLPEASEETDNSTEESAEESAGNETQEEPVNTDAPESADDAEDESDNETEDNNNEETNDSDQESAEQETEVSDENAEDTNQDSEENEEPTESDTNADGEVSSSLVDSATGVRVVSATNELEGKSVVVTVMNPSNAIGATHDLYDIHILDENGSLYSLNNPVTVYLPANGYVSNVYYLGDIGETLEAVNYTTADGYAVFEVDSFSQYAVVYGNDNEDNTTVPVVTADSGTGGEEAADQANEHPTVYTETDVTAEDEAAVAGSDDANQNGSGAAKEAREAEMLPDTGTPEQSTTIYAAILAALGLGFLVKRRKTTEK